MIHLLLLVSALQFHRLPLNDALSQNTVPALLQDRGGRMWFGTLEGLNVFDGYRFRLIPTDPREPDALAGLDIQRLMEDRQGFIWIAGLWGSGWIDRLEESTGKVTHLPSELFGAPDLPGSASVAFYQASDETVFIGTNTGLHRYHPDSGRLELRLDKRITAVSDIAGDEQGRLWLATPTGLDRYDPKSGALQTYRHDPANPRSLVSDATTALLVAADHSLWIGTQFGLSHMEGNGFRNFRHEAGDPTSLGGDIVRALLQDRDGNLWIGSHSGGLSRYQDGHFEVSLPDPNDENSLSSADVWSIYQDRSGLIWIGTTAAGLNQINTSTSRFHSLRSVPFDHNSMRNRFVWDIKEDLSKAIWISTLGGLERYDPKTGRLSFFAPTASNVVRNQLEAIEVDAKGRLWVGAVDGHLYRLAPEDGKFHNVPRGAAETFSRNRIWYIGKGTAGRIWVGISEGLFSVDTETGRVVETIPSSERVPMGEAPVRVSLLDAEGNEWFGSGAVGLVRYQAGKGITGILGHEAGNPESLSSNLIRALYQAPNGDLWIGTHNGLNRLSSEDRSAARNRFTIYTKRDGLPDNTIYGILPEGDNQHLWLSSNRGLSRFDLKSGTFRNFDVNDGLAANEFNGGASLVASDGRLYFGSVNGVTWFLPGSLPFNTSVPQARITRVDRHDGSPLSDAAQLEVDYDRTSVSIDFAAMDFHQPTKNRFRYRLLGPKGGNWVDTDRPSVDLAVLESGDYRFEVMASNNDGVWSEAPATLGIRVKPPWWASPVAYLAYALTLVLCGVAYHLAQRKKLMREREFSEQLRREHSLAEANYQLALRYAQIDQLTQLPNRATLLDSLGHSMRASRSQGRMLGLFSIDLDRFQQINDSLGHAVGDQVLQWTTERFKAALGEGGYLARSGGDEFVLMARQPEGGDQQLWLETLAARLHVAASTPYDLRDPPLVVTASIGVAAYACGPQTASDLLGAAEIAMQLAKRERGATTRHYRSGMLESAKEKLQLEARMKKALEADEFVPHYQPIMDLNSGRLAGMEALIRWFPPQGSPIYPNQFIPIAEESGLIVELGTFMLRAVCKQIAVFCALGVRGVSAAVNVSMRQLRGGTLLPILRGLLEEFAIPPEMLKLEITESAVMESALDTAEQLTEIRKLGVKIAIDDFGTGFSSLGYLKMLPVNEMKIDRSFVIDIATSEQSRKIVSSIIRLAHELKLSTVAEGVEDEVSLRLLRELGCDLAQGYYFAKPMSAADLIAQGWLRR